MNRARVLKFPQPEIRSVSVDPLTKEILIRIAPGSDTLAHIGHVLQSLEELIRYLRMLEGSTTRDIANDAAKAQRRTRLIELARAYQRLRLVGVKHRAAINTLFIDPAFTDLHLSTSDIAWAIKAYVLSSQPKRPR